MSYDSIESIVLDVCAAAAETGVMSSMSSVLGLIGAAIGLVAAFFWCRSGCVSWRVGRDGMELGDFSVEKPKDTFRTPCCLPAYFQRVSNLNRKTAFLTGLAMFLWAAQSIADVLTKCRP